jgi:ribosome-associated translation inhibitor RaiA
MSMEPSSGRREYDGDHVDPVTRNYVEDRLRETRHEFRNDIAALAAAQAAAALQQTKEHGEVRAEISHVINEVAGVRRDLAVVLPLPETVAQLKHRDDLEEARTEAIDKLRRQQRWFAAFIVGAVPAAAIIAPHIH